MKIEIDQSGRIEYTSHKTVIAFSNKREGAILISAKTKRQVQEVFRRSGQPKLFTLRTFAAGVVFLLSQYGGNIEEVIIDMEYPGNDNVLREMILEMAKVKKLNIQDIRISFFEIGKKSNAHYVAYGVFKEKIKPQKVISFKELVELAIKQKRPRV